MGFLVNKFMVVNLVIVLIYLVFVLLILIR